MRHNLASLGLLFTGAAVGAVVSLCWTQPGRVVYAEATLPAPPPAAAVADGFESVVGRLAPTVVAVDAVKPNQPTSTGKSKPQEESGSGVLLSFDGFRGVFAVTNNHVINGAKESEITVTLYDGRILRPTAVRTDPETDIALLKLDAPNLKPASLGDSDRVRPGQWVVAFGSPFGLSQSVTHGIISAKDRGQISLGNTIRIKEFLQTDAAINPGSSGGPLVSTEGQIIGINTAIASNSGSNSGVAFAIPINLVKRVARELLEKGVVNRGYLGLQLSPTLEPTEALRLGLERVRGALVDTINPGSPAANAGLKPKDVVLTLEDVELRDENHLINLVSNLPPAQRVKLGVWRDRQLRVIEVVIGDWAATRR